ncbi:MAG: DNA-binding protein [Ignavibacteriae bacterium]|nr:DNA-binding protein [Ignavibacteriota bacterium]
MKKLLAFLIVLQVFFLACNEKTENSENIPAGMQKITVTEHMNGGGYTFLKGDENGQEFWVAIRQMPVENGETYYFKDAMEMKNFESKSLNKTFASILFVNEISKSATSEQKQIPQMAASSDHTKPKVEASSNISVEHLSDGKTVETIAKDKKNLSGKKIKIKGVVTKYNGGIMGRNWIHIQDGTKFGETVDITVTSNQDAKVGNTIIVEGFLALDKDFGAGYFYDMIIEDASIVVEKEI